MAENEHADVAEELQQQEPQQEADTNETTAVGEYKIGPEAAQPDAEGESHNDPTGVSTSAEGESEQAEPEPQTVADSSADKVEELIPPPILPQISDNPRGAASPKPTSRPPSSTIRHNGSPNRPKSPRPISARDFGINIYRPDSAYSVPPAVVARCGSCLSFFVL